MAIMYPRLFPTDCRSNAERKVFHALRDLVSNVYSVFYSVPMYRESHSRGGISDGEIDFLLVHPIYGLIVIEVKGGGIAHETATQQWFSTNYSGERHLIKDPFEQAKGYKYLLREDLKSCRLTGRFKYPLAHAVWFPDVVLAPQKLGLSVQIEKLVLDASALDSAAAAVSKLFENALGETPESRPGDAGLNALVAYLSPHWDFTPTLSAQLYDENREITQATKGQYRVLSLMSRVPRALISGGAGSGKTLLALEKAKRMADSGSRVLLLCFNKMLARWLEEHAAEGIEAFHFHGFCTELCRRAGIPLPVPDPHADSSSYFDHVLPDALLDALAETDERYDAIVVDEGQDFCSTWWVPIQEALCEPRDGVFYIFFDDNQAIYNSIQEFPLSGPPFTLSDNCRNTQCIHEEVSRFYRGQHDILCLGPKGRPVEVVSGVNLVLALQTTIKRLVHQEGLSPSDIVVLSPLAQQRSKIPDRHAIGNLKLSWSDNASQGSVFCSTIHGFKGLESPVVILCELDEVYPGMRNALLYVGMSRAKNHLIIVGREDVAFS